MTPLHFENLYRAEWDELESQLTLILDGRTKQKNSFEPIRGDRVAELYRRACEHLALARARDYPRYLLDRLESLTSDAHQVIYQRREFGLGRLKRMFTQDFPRAVRAHSTYVWIATAISVVPMLLMGWLVYERPDLILSVLDGDSAAEYEQMYSDSAETLGNLSGAEARWQMFGFYIGNNIGVSFRFFASGLFAGIGSIFFMLLNAVHAGALAGYLTERGLSGNFYSFVVTHAAFELTAFVLAGAAGLRLGHSLIAPGRQTRVQSLTQAARETIVMVYGIIVMLLIAAAIEAFWSSARWMPLPLKYSVAAVCWLGVLAYLTFQGRRAD